MFDGAATFNGGYSKRAAPTGPALYIIRPLVPDPVPAVPPRCAARPIVPEVHQLARILASFDAFPGGERSCRSRLFDEEFTALEARRQFHARSIR